MPRERTSGWRIEAIDELEALERLEPEWEALWERCGHGTPFQHPAWLLPWWRHLGEGELRSLALRRGGRLVALAPLYLYREPETGLRRLFPLGIGTSDYLDALAEPEVAREAFGALFAHLESEGEDWDRFELPQLPADSPLLAAPAPAAWEETGEPGEVCPALDLSAGEGRALPARMLHNLRYYRRRAERLGPVRIEDAETAGPEPLLEALFRLHARRWALRGEAGVLSDERIQRQHREAAPRLLARGLLRLLALRIGDRIAAVYYGLFDPRPGRRRAFYYLGGFDPEFAAVSPGTLLVGEAIRRAVEEGAETFDLLRGREAYKYLWGAGDRAVFCRRFRRAPREAPR